MTTYDVLRLEPNGARRLMISFGDEQAATDYLTGGGCVFDAGRGVWFAEDGEAFVIEGVA